jgi:hypothetical protein
MLLSVKKERVQNILVNQGGHGLIYLYQPILLHRQRQLMMLKHFLKHLSLH